MKSFLQNFVRGTAEILLVLLINIACCWLLGLVFWILTGFQGRFGE